MSIPLVKKLDLDSINTSIIAIKRLLQQAGVSEGGNTIINNSSQGGIPLGTWASFENDSAPNGEWLQGGTSFDSNTYPALAMMLGGNTVPQRFDHSRLGDFETFELNTQYTAEYDGFIYVRWRCSSSSSNYYIEINGQQFQAETTTSTLGIPASFPIKKGDVWKVVNSSDSVNYKTRWYKHPMFIKATPTSSDSDYEGTLNGIRQYVSNSNSYSTEEKWTGGYFIDGKKIYRKCYIESSAGSWTNGQVLDTIANFETFVGTSLQAYFSGTRNSYYCNMGLGDGRGFLVPNVSGEIKLNLSGTINTVKKWGWVEYTKTTD